MMVRLQRDGEDTVVKEHFVSDDPRDLIGPPYMVAEHVFDEDALKGCYATRGKRPS